MAITTIYTYPLNGTQRDFTIPFEYLARRFVVLTLIGTDRKELVLTTDYRFTSKTNVQTTVPWGPADGYERIEIRRNTSATDRLVDFADGSILRASELNTSQVQTLHVAEEARNMVADTISTNQDGDLDARGRRLVNLADAVSPDHAVTLRQEQAWAQSTLGNRNASEAARVASEQARDVAITNRDQAGAFKDQTEAAKTISETARDQSVAAAGTIGNNVTLAQQARAGAEAARDTTVASAQSVQGVNIPSAIGNGLKWLRQKADELGFEYVEAYTKSAVDALIAGIQAAQSTLEGRVSSLESSRTSYRYRQKLETLWSGSVGQAGVAIPLSRPLVEGDVLWIQHNDGQKLMSHPLVVTSLNSVAGRNWYWTCGGGVSTYMTFNSASQFTTVGFTAGYGLERVLCSRAGL